ncbi:MAG TPA: hypothetical protein VFK13_02155 [Gemmatimonadaceae bacterium]|nr:hypothetical protein [Gemmatimonadaceae bacterium]
MGGTLIVTDRLMSPHVAFIDLASGAVTSHFGRHGDGPQEFQDPDWLVADSSGHAVWIYDFDRRNNVLVDFGNPAEPRVRGRRSLNVGVSIESPFAVGDTVVATGVFLDYTALVMDSAGKVIRRVASPPAFDANDIPHTTGRRQLNRAFMALGPGRDRFALFFQWRNRIDLFTTYGPTRYASARGPQDTKAVFFVDGYDRFHWGDDAEMAYVGGAASDRYVYGLFCGCRGSAEPRHVHVFTWAGEFVADLEIDNPMLAIAASDDDAVLYGATEEPYPRGAEFTLPTFLP